MIEEFLGVFKKEGSANPQRYLADLGVKYQSLHCGLKPPQNHILKMYNVYKFESKLLYENIGLSGSVKMK